MIDNLRLGLISDTHLGITSEYAIKKMLEELATHEFDVLVHAGDYSGEGRGFEPLEATIELMRAQFPDKPILTVLGNHDYWCQSPLTRTQSQEDFRDNLQKISECFKKNSIHFMDADGVYVHPNHPTIKFMGASGWYRAFNPPTNDARFLPFSATGNIHHDLMQVAYYILDQNEQLLSTVFQPDTDKLVFISHFPVIRGPDYKDPRHGFDKFGGDEGIALSLQQKYNCKYFLNGHAHMRIEGDNGRYECGSDYYHPRYLLIEVK